VAFDQDVDEADVQGRTETKVMLAGCLWLFCSERKGPLVADKQGNRALRCAGEGRARSMGPTSAGVEWLRGWEAEQRPVRLAYQPPASSTFLSEQTSNQPVVLFSQNKPPAKRTACRMAAGLGAARDGTPSRGLLGVLDSCLGRRQGSSSSDRGPFFFRRRAVHGPLATRP
jgi:hypothetical protein